MNWFVSGQSGTANRFVDTQHLLGGNFAIKKPVADQYNLRFDPAIQYGGSEYDFFRQATQAGLH
jgi:hypothetical protein